MTTSILKTARAATDDSLPRKYNHPLLTRGTLSLIEPAFNMAKTALPQPTAVVHGTKFPNLGYLTAAALIGSGDILTLSPTVSLNLTAQEGKVELSGKKGLVTITSQTGNSGHAMKLVQPDLIKSYMLANPTRKYYFSIAFQVIRTAGATLTDYYRLLYSRNTSPTSNYWAIIRKADVRPNTGTGNHLGTRLDANKELVGYHFISVATNGYTGSTLPATIASLVAEYSVQHGATSEILYRTMIVDLEAAKLTYAQMDALDYAKYQLDIGPGGMFTADTFTDPATLP